MLYFFIFVIILIIIIIAIVALYNSIVYLRNNVKQSKSGIDVYLQQRFNLIPNLVEVTKAYMNYEKEVLEKIIQLRNDYEQNKDIKVANELNSQYTHIMALSENYPELKASEQFLKLQSSLIKIESQLQAARRIYNNDITRYNVKISIFPNNIIAVFFGFEQEDLFSLEGDSEIEVKI